MIILVPLALAAGAFFYFTISYLSSRRSWRTATKIQRWNAQIEETQSREAKAKPSERVLAWAADKGWEGDLLPLVMVASFVYAAFTLVLFAFGITTILAALAAVPLSLFTGWVSVRVSVERRRQKFRRQLLQALNLMASQIESGSGPQRALEQIVSQLEDPIGLEFSNALAQTVATKDLIGALTELEVHYPSRAFAMFIAALEMDRQQGGSLAPALRQAAKMLSLEFELTEEAQAEVSQTRAEFFIVSSIIGGICVVLFASARSNPASLAAYTSPTDMAIIGAFIANFAWGCYRVLRLLNKAKGRS